MLQSLTIQNIAIVKSTTLEFDQGLSVLTGQTGAGKSLLLDSLSLCLGARADKTLIRQGCDQAVITAEFKLSQDTPVTAILHNAGFEFKNISSLIIRRILYPQASGRCFVNDQPVSLNLIRNISPYLMEIHQQFDRLLDPASHRDVLDDYGRSATLKQSVSMAFHEWREARNKLSEKRSTLESLSKEKEFLEFKVKELQDFDPQLGEEDSLVDQRNFLKQKESILQAYNSSFHILEQQVPQGLFQVQKNLAKFEDEITHKVHQSIDQSIGLLNEATEALADKIRSFEHAGLTLEEVEDRLFAMRHLARKYQCLPQELLGMLEEGKNRLDELNTGTTSLHQLEKDVNVKKDAFLKAAQALSNHRKEKSAELEKYVNQELPPLKLNQARFKIDITQLPEENWSEKGLDHLEFMIDMNQQGAFNPLHKVASGGEMARLMLAIKVCLARSGMLPGLVFDEVDSGVGGDVADAVGKRLLQLSQALQVLVITHSPQVASRGNHHYYISKTNTEDGVTTQVRILQEKERIEEIARMISGDRITDEARAAAQVLLSQSD